MGKPWRLHLRAKIISGGTAEIYLAQIASSSTPAAVVPWPQHDKIVIGLIEFLERRISRERSVIVFLVPPAADDQRRHVSFLQIVSRAAGLPVIVIAGMGDERIPRRK